MLTNKESTNLEKSFSMQDLKDVILNSEWGKSLGPNGFGMEFYKECWDIIKENLFECVNEFFTHDHMPKVMSSSLLTLISKNANPQNFNEFRLICLIGSVYKIITKLPVGRQNKVIGGSYLIIKLLSLRIGTC